MQAREDAAWGSAATSESRWPSSIAVVVALILYVSLPDQLTMGPRWLVPVLELALLFPLMVVAPRRVQQEASVRRAEAIVLIAIINAANVASLALLVHSLTIATGSKATGLQLLLSAASIWFTNIIVFGLWYWELDRGGPHKRLSSQHEPPDFLFPQMVTPGCAPRPWSPRFIDYLFVSFTNASAFSPTDTMPLTPVAKMLFLVQAVTSLLTVALVAARAVNILS
jgi:uncharacterized membrane protein